MSAFLCTPEHLAQLAIAYCNDLYEKAKPRDVVLKMLAMNQESLKARYPDDFDEFVIDHANPEELEYFPPTITAFKSKAVRDQFVGSWQDYATECIAAVSKGKDLALGWVDLYRMAQCFSYQSCENKSIWEGGNQIGHTFFNAAHCELLKDRIVVNNNTAAYEAAPWGSLTHTPRYEYDNCTSGGGAG